MASGFGGVMRSFWHTMTSYDRHASHNSPYRSGQHMPLNQSRHAPITSIATSAMESRADLGYHEEGPQSGSAMHDGFIGSPRLGPAGGSAPYSPGMRSDAAAGKRRGSNDPFDPISPGEIQMQSFQEGLPPPPPTSHSWKRIDRWVEDNYQELYDQLCEGCTQNDINELEHEMDCSLPIEVRESLQCHDGQERGGRPTGIVFGCMLLDCEEIVQEWKNWKVVNEEYLSSGVTTINMQSSKSFAGPSSNNMPTSSGPNPLWRQDLLDKQDSQPPRAIQKAYAHPAWIPLARDWGGNNIAVDLAPGPTGKWGQIIIFGRDYDCKYVVARSWSAFLATLADDFGSDKPFVDEETQELKLREFKGQNVEPGYLDILRWRTDQKYGRRIPKKKAPSLRTSVNGGSRQGSPYGSPTSERGRSPNRYPAHGQVVQGGGSTNSPRMAPARLASTLASVPEANSPAIIKPQPLPLRRDLPEPSRLSVPAKRASVNVSEKLVEAPTPGAGPEGGLEHSIAGRLERSLTKEEVLSPASVLSPREGEGLMGRKELDGLEDEMKTVAI